MQCESALIHAKFERERRAWDRLYHRKDYPALGIQWRRDDGVDLCREHVAGGGRILDLGCGCGHASLALGRRGFRVHGIDFSQGMIEKARRNAIEASLEDRCSFEVRDVLDPTLTGPYDGLIGLGFVEYFDDLHALLERLRGLLTGQGVAVLQVWNRAPWADTLFEPADALVRAAGRLVRAAATDASAAGPPDVRHRRYTPREFRSAAGRTGFEVVGSRGSLFFPHRFFVGEKRRARWDRALRSLGRHAPFVRHRAVNVLIALRAP